MTQIFKKIRLIENVKVLTRIATASKRLIGHYCIFRNIDHANFVHYFVVPIQMTEKPVFSLCTQAYFLSTISIKLPKLSKKMSVILYRGRKKQVVLVFFQLDGRGRLIDYRVIYGQTKFLVCLNYIQSNVFHFHCLTFLYSPRQPQRVVQKKLTFLANLSAKGGGGQSPCPQRNLSFCGGLKKSLEFYEKK